jgi:hypothetical protein
VLGGFCCAAGEQVDGNFSSGGFEHRGDVSVFFFADLDKRLNGFAYAVKQGSFVDFNV